MRKDKDALRTHLPRIIYRRPKLLAPIHEELRLLVDVLFVVPRGVDLDRDLRGAEAADDGADARFEEGAALRDHEVFHGFGEDGVAAAGGEWAISM